MARETMTREQIEAMTKEELVQKICSYPAGYAPGNLTGDLARRNREALATGDHSHIPAEAVAGWWRRHLAVIRRSKANKKDVRNPLVFLLTLMT